MPEKTAGERLARIETLLETHFEREDKKDERDQQDHEEIKELLTKQNGRVRALERWRTAIVAGGSAIIGYVKFWPIIRG